MTNGNNLCIIGQEKSDSNIKLLEESKKVFDSVFFVPIHSISIGFTNDFSIKYRTSDLLKFKALLPRIPKDHFSYAYQLFSMFPEDTYTPIKPVTFLLANERFFLLTIMRKRGVHTLNLSLSRSPEAAKRIVEVRKFPLIIRTPQKKSGVIVNSLSEAKGIIDTLSSLGQTILVEDVIKDLVSVYVGNGEVMASVRKKASEKDIIFSKGELKNHKTSSEIEELAIDAANAIDAQIARVDISPEKDPKVVDVDLTPYLITPSAVTGVNIPERIVKIISDNYQKHKEKPMLLKFFEDAKSVMNDVLKTKHLI